MSIKKDIYDLEEKVETYDLNNLTDEQYADLNKLIELQNKKTEIAQSNPSYITDEEFQDYLNNLDSYAQTFFKYVNVQSTCIDFSDETNDHDYSIVINTKDKTQIFHYDKYDDFLNPDQIDSINKRKDKIYRIRFVKNDKIVYTISGNDECIEYLNRSKIIL